MDLLNRTHPHNHGREGFLARSFEEYVSALSARLASQPSPSQQAQSPSQQAQTPRGPELSYEGFDFNHEMNALNHDKLQEFLQRLVSGTLQLVVLVARVPQVSCHAVCVLSARSALCVCPALGYDRRRRGSASARLRSATATSRARGSRGCSA